MSKQTTGIAYALYQRFITEDDPRFEVVGCGCLFQNVGTYPVELNDFVLLPGDVKKFDVQPPHSLEFQLSVKFSDTDTGATSLRLSPRKRVLFECLLPKYE